MHRTISDILCTRIMNMFVFYWLVLLLCIIQKVIKQTHYFPLLCVENVKCTPVQMYFLCVCSTVIGFVCIYVYLQKCRINTSRPILFSPSRAIMLYISNGSKQTLFQQT